MGGSASSCCFHEHEKPLKQSLQESSNYNAKSIDTFYTKFPTKSKKSWHQRKESSGPTQDRPKHADFDSFNILKEVGEGGYGKVYKVELKETGQIYAMKKLNKKNIVEGGELMNLLTEKSVLTHAEHEFVVKLHYAFQNKKFVFLVMDFIDGGALFTHLRAYGKFKVNAVRFYAAEVLIGLEYLHNELDIIYRDLKPENILLDSEGHVKLADFGLSKSGDLSYSFCGTPEYLAPEIIKQQGHGKAVDLWSFGCLIYEMLKGKPLFYNSEQNRGKLYESILHDDPELEPDIPPEIQNLISKLVEKEPEKRLGYESLDEIKRARFFATINWTQIKEKKVYPPFRPNQKYDLYDLLETVPVFPKGEFTPGGSNSVINKDISGFTYPPRTQKSPHLPTPKSQFQNL